MQLVSLFEYMFLQNGRKLFIQQPAETKIQKVETDVCYIRPCNAQDQGFVCWPSP